ncbi:related to BRE2 - subunit of COMPASS (Set1C) complex [Melanopsichium pennsylvanicum]|uniref:Related to BRE2 - subunit of COMPASS (Set1C) complex n=2 Tax=Melanopsichium pennsylvanicum TaxID=63383 RepID=A0AAJ5C3Q9_9BASI|nr:conserved hypothetical protein [Melanopsichium pennsylvanicum 4]SNX82724.1 related to BRE2 - subunit of COMPASS (Set1C) complex [Melanopsichium pennsylvanicum]
MDVDTQAPQQFAPPLAAHDGPTVVVGAFSSGSAANGIHTIPSTNKRKYDDLTHLDVASQSIVSASSSPPHTYSPLAPSSSPHHVRSASSTPAPHSQSEAQRVYIARTAPHLLDHIPTPTSSRSPSLPPSRRSSPSSDDDRSTPDAATSSTPTHPSTNQSHHTLPQNYRGPTLRKNDPEDFAPPPHLVPTPGFSTMFNTINFAVNRNGWRYTAAGPASQQLPQTLFKTLETRPATVHWCWSDRSPFTKISADADVVSTDKGFRSARTNIGVREGEWYTEIEILPPEHLVAGAGAPGVIPTPMKDGSHIRLGWGRREAPLNAPVGFDGYSYGFRDKTGDKVTLSRPLPYGKPFKAGDVVGLYIKLPPQRLPQDEHDPANIKRERVAIRYKNQLYFESLEYPRTREMEQLMERSRKGNSIEEALKGIEGTGVFEPQHPSQTVSSSSDVANGMAGAPNANAVSASTSVPTGSSGSAKVKTHKNPGKSEKPSGPSIPSLRPVPKLSGSKIGFFVNGEPQGIAFTDLLDYRPLRVKGFSGLKSAVPTKPSISRSTKADPTKKGQAVEPVINVKPRENVFDDGALGYFPFVSSYGGARAKLITGEHGFRYPPPDEIEAVLERATSSSSSSTFAIGEQGATGEGKGRRWRPLCERFDEHLSEMWAYDLADEAKAQAVHDKQAEEKARRNNAAKERYAAAKKKHAAALARNATASPGPAATRPVDIEDDADRTVTAEAEDGDGNGMQLDVEHVNGQAAAVAGRQVGPDANGTLDHDYSEQEQGQGFEPGADDDGNRSRRSSTEIQTPEPPPHMLEQNGTYGWSRPESPPIEPEGRILWLQSKREGETDAGDVEMLEEPSH